MASVTKRNGAYTITVCCGYDVNNKKIRKKTTYHPEEFTKTGKRKKESVIEKEVADFAREFERKVLSGEYGDGDNMLLVEYAQKYIDEYAKIELSPTTYTNYERIIDTRIIPVFGHFKLGEIRPLRLQEHFNSQLSERKLSASTIKKDIRLFSSMMQQAVRWGLIKENPVHNVNIPRIQQEESVKCFNLDQAQRFLDFLEQPQQSIYKSHERVLDGNSYSVSEYVETRYIALQLQLFFNIALYGGARKGELIALTWSDFYFETNIIDINKATVKAGGKMITKEPKNKTSVRKLKMPDSVMKMAKRWKRVQQELRLKAGDAWQGSDFVFTQVDGSQMYTDTPYQAFKRIIHRYNETVEDDMYYQAFYNKLIFHFSSTIKEVSV